jgi:hypothetical protein
MERKSPFKAVLVHSMVEFLDPFIHNRPHIVAPVYKSSLVLGDGIDEDPHSLFICSAVERVISKQKAEFEDAASLVLVSSSRSKCVARGDRRGSDEGHIAAHKEPLTLIGGGRRE